ncbi:MAG: Holliday junction resolvase RuvX [Chitinophagales bacterium]
MAFDYGAKRVGIAVTDPLKIIATGLTTCASEEIYVFVESYMHKESVELFVVGYPTNLNGHPTHATPLVQKFISQLRKKWPQIPIETWDETFSSRLAVKAMVDSGMKKKQRRDKATIDKISAVIILQEYLEHL